jgi:hypothetical protein
LARLRVVLAGIVQGGLAAGDHDQDYRARISAIVRLRHPQAEVVDPEAQRPNRATYDDEQARTAFLEIVADARTADVLVAFLPAASMGAAIEVWEAYRAGVPVVTISPLSQNWTVRICSARVLSDLNAFEAFVDGGGLLELTAEGGAGYSAGEPTSS